MFKTAEASEDKHMHDDALTLPQAARVEDARSLYYYLKTGAQQTRDSGGLELDDTSRTRTKHDIAGVMESAGNVRRSRV